MKDTFLYNLDDSNETNFRGLGRLLSRSGLTYRDPRSASGLKVVVLGATPELRIIQKSEDLAALIADHLVVSVIKDGKPKGNAIPPAELRRLLKSELFLQEFSPLDCLIAEPIFLPESFHLTEPGYHDGGPGQRFYYAGEPARVSRETATIRRFLDAMSFASVADKTNAVAAALTVVLRNHLPGQKPLFAVTANRSHAGKGTVVKFATGATKSSVVHFEDKDWAFKKNIYAPLQNEPNLGVINIDNVHADTKGGPIRSSFLEALLHDPRLTIPGSNGKNTLVIDNHFVVFTTGNGIKFNEDMLNRTVSIRLEMKGDASKRNSEIGDPKNEFLPKHQDEIRAELYGMIQHWVDAGKPRCQIVRHNCCLWSQIIGGVLEVAGFKGFLENEQERRSSDDSTAEALAELGAAYPDQWHTATGWVGRIADLGLTKTLIPANDRESQISRARGTGRVFSHKEGVTFTSTTEDEVLTLCLKKSRRRFEDGKAESRYQFEVLSRKPLPQTQE